jgi:hypothetical protein
MQSQTHSKACPVYTEAMTMLPSDLGYKQIEEVFGFTVGEFQSLESTMLDTIDSLTKLEEYWIANGHALLETTPH